MPGDPQRQPSSNMRAPPPASASLNHAKQYEFLDVNVKLPWDGRVREFNIMDKGGNFIAPFFFDQDAQDKYDKINNTKVSLSDAN